MIFSAAALLELTIISRTPTNSRRSSGDINPPNCSTPSMVTRTHARLVVRIFTKTPTPLYCDTAWGNGLASKRGVKLGASVMVGWSGNWAKISLCGIISTGDMTNCAMTKKITATAISVTTTTAIRLIKRKKRCCANSRSSEMLRRDCGCGILDVILRGSVTGVGIAPLVADVCWRTDFPFFLPFLLCVLRPPRRLLGFLAVS